MLCASLGQPKADVNVPKSLREGKAECPPVPIFGKLLPKYPDPSNMLSIEFRRLIKLGGTNVNLFKVIVADSIIGEPFLRNQLVFGGNHGNSEVLNCFVSGLEEVFTPVREFEGDENFCREHAKKRFPEPLTFLGTFYQALQPYSL